MDHPTIAPIITNACTRAEAEPEQILSDRLNVCKAKLKIETMSVEVEGRGLTHTHGGGARRRRRTCGRHSGVDVELQHHVVPGLHLGRPPEHVARGPPERAGAADHRELPDGRRDVVQAGHGDGAAVVGPARERHGHGHRQHGLRERRQRVGPPRAPDQPRRRRGALRQGVVHHRGVAEVVARRHRRVRRPRALHDHHRRLPGAARDVVHVEVEVDEAAAAAASCRRRRRWGGEGRHQRDEELFEAASSYVSGGEESDADEGDHFPGAGGEEGGQDRQRVFVPQPLRRMNSDSIYDMASMMSQLPAKKGLSRYYEGKSQSFACMSEVRCLEDLRKKDRPYQQKKIKSYKSYVALAKKASSGSCADLSLAAASGFTTPPIQNGYHQ